MIIFGVNYPFKIELVNSPSIVLSDLVSVFHQYHSHTKHVFVCMQVNRKKKKKKKKNTIPEETSKHRKARPPQEVRCVHSAITAKSRLHFFDRMHNIHKHL